MRYFLLHCVVPAVGPNGSPVQSVRKNFYAGLKCSGHEAEHCPPFNAAVISVSNYTPAASVFIAQWLIRNKDNFKWNIRTPS
jgi:hypothetical protein